MSTRHENSGRRRSRRSLHDDDDEDKTNKDSTNRSRYHDRHRRRHDRAVNNGSMDRYRAQERDFSTPEHRHRDRRQRRRRRHSATRRRRTDRDFDDGDEDARYHRDEDDYRQSRRHGRGRQQRSCFHRSRKKKRRRSSSLSSSSSSSDSYHHHRREPRNRKRRRSHRLSRRSRSRSHTSTEQECNREEYDHSRDNELDARSNYHHHHHNRNQFNNEAVRQIPRAGVVSDDDDGYQHAEEQQDTSNHSKKHATAIATSSRWHPPSQPAANHQATTPTMTGSQNLEERWQHDGGKSNTKNSTYKKRRKASPPPPPNVQEKDDTIGHFQGRDGHVIADRYRILKEVGVGTFGRVVECLDIKRRRERQSWNDNYYSRRENDGSHQHQHQHPPYHSRRERERRHENPNNIVAIKIVRNVKRYYDSAKIEADIIEDVNRRGRQGMTHCAVMYDTFSFDGHYCMVFECLGPSLYDFLKSQKYHPFPIQCVRDFARQLLETLEFLHSFRLIHTDLKPENILLLNGRQVPQKGGYGIPESTRIKVIDFGGATYDNEKKSSIVNTRQYRAPEVILGVGWSMPSDLWSIGCILAELYQGELLFATHDNVEHLALIERVVGPFPRKMLKRAKNVELVHEAFDSNGSHRMDRVLPADQLSYVKRTAPLESITTYDDDAWLLRLLRRILIIDPDERATAQECLRKF